MLLNFEIPEIAFFSIALVFVEGVIVVDVSLVLVILVLMRAESANTNNLYVDVECQ